MSTSACSDEVPVDLASCFAQTTQPVLTATEVAEQLGITQQGAHHKLQRAHEKGAVEKKKVGSRAVVWWVPDLTV